jgi:hypothetical protein
MSVVPATATSHDTTPEVQIQVKQDLLAINEAILVTDLDPSKKRMLQLRVNGLLAEYLFRCRVYSVTFHGLRITTTIGSLIVPALLSVQYVNGNVSTQSATIGVQVYWTVWILSLFVTVCNGLLNLMKIDKKYYMIHTCYQHLLSEVWQYLQLSGKYSGLYTQGEQATHLNQYIYICNMLEKIRMKHIEEEYYKVLEQSTSRQAESLIPPTPFKVSVEENSTPPVNGEITLRKVTRETA